MALEMYQLAAFTSQPFGGNPAAVVPLEHWIDEALMQRIAAENNLSETAFFVPAGNGEWQIRWFTPSVEVPLCGHATLASAAVIRDRLGWSDWPITLHSASGALTVDTDGNGFVLDFPANPPQPVSAPEGLREALGTDAIEETMLGRDIYMVVLPDEAAVASLSPDFAALAQIVEHGIVATAPGEEVDFVSRFFAPAIGINEDPVTGAAHCLLTPYWSSRSGRNTLQARQISDRVGYLECEACDDRVRLAGRAVFFLDGRISI
jgi:PhzF family phenazine biosynthesis protein